MSLSGGFDGVLSRALFRAPATNFDGLGRIREVLVIGEGEREKGKKGKGNFGLVEGNFEIKLIASGTIII